MSELPPLYCGSYRPGHAAHWIQALHSSDAGEDPPVEGRLLDVRPDGTLTIEVGGRRFDYWHHQPDRLVALVAPNDGAVSVQRRWSLLRTASSDGSYVFNICVPADQVPCPDEEPTGDLFERMEKAGGFSLPIDEALALLGDPPDAPSERAGLP